MKSGEARKKTFNMEYMEYMDDMDAVAAYSRVLVEKFF